MALMFQLWCPISRVGYRYEAVFQDDNARPQHARGVQDSFRQHGIQMMGWPARSPDVNPKEHLLDLLERRVRGRAQVPQTVSELRQALNQE